MIILAVVCQEHAAAILHITSFSLKKIKKFGVLGFALTSTMPDGWMAFWRSVLHFAVLAILVSKEKIKL